MWSYLADSQWGFSPTMTHQRGRGGVRSGLSSRKTFWLYNENVFSFSGYNTSGKRAGLV